MTRPAAVALAGSLLLHFIAMAVLSVTLLARTDVDPRADAQTSINLVLNQHVAAAPAGPIEPDPEPDPTKELPDSLDTSKLARVAERQPTPVVSTAPKLEETRDPETLAPAPALDLRRPAAWQSLAIQSPEELSSSAFKKSTRDAIALRQQERARTRALSRAQVERLGLPEEVYRRRTDTGEEVKTAKGCFVKRAENGPNGHSERWWRTACRDSSKPQWQRELLTFGPDHRALPNATETQPLP